MSKDDIPNGIPAFLRRPEERWPESPLFGIGTAQGGCGAATVSRISGDCLVAFTSRAEPTAGHDDAAAADDVSARSRAATARGQDTAPESGANDGAQTLEIELPAPVARALKARARHEGRTESAIVLAALRHTGLIAPTRRRAVPQAQLPRRHRRRRA